MERFQIEQFKSCLNMRSPELNKQTPFPNKFCPSPVTYGDGVGCFQSLWQGRRNLQSFVLKVIAAALSLTVKDGSQ